MKLWHTRWAQWLDPSVPTESLLQLAENASNAPPWSQGSQSGKTAVGIFPMPRGGHELGNFAFGVVDFVCEARRCQSATPLVILLGEAQSARLDLSFLSAIGFVAPEAVTLDELEGACISLSTVSSLANHKQAMVTSDLLDEARLCAAFRALDPGFIYVGPGYRPGKVLRDFGIPLISPIVKGPWSQPLAKCPSGSKRPPAGACLRGSLRFTLERQDTLLCACACDDLSVEAYLHKVNEWLPPQSSAEKTHTHLHAEPHVVEHATKLVNQRVSYAVMLFGAPTVSSSNLDLLAIANAHARRAGCVEPVRLLVEDVTASIAYPSYDRQAVHALYAEVATKFGAVLSFTSDRSGFETDVRAWLGRTSLANATPYIPGGKLSRSRGQYTVYDAVHLAAMAATWVGHEHYSLVLHAKNVLHLKGIMDRLPPSYVVCHGLRDDGPRYRSAAEFRMLFNGAEEAARFPRQTPASASTTGAPPRTVKSSRRRLDHLQMVTGWCLERRGGGVSISVRNTLDALRQRDVHCSLPMTRGVADWMQFDQRDEANTHLKLEGDAPCLCIDWDGYTLKGLRAGGSRLKVVHVRTNFADIEAFETDEVAAQCRKMAARLRQNLATADGVIASSSYSLARLQPLIPIGTPTAVVHNGIDDELLARLGEQPIGKAPMVLALGSFHRRKSFDTLVLASKVAAAQGVVHRLVISGGGPELARLEAMAAGCPHISLRPFVTDTTELAGLYSSAALVCHPALQEDFGNVYIEAGAARKPIIAARCGAAPELVHDGKSGLLFEPEAVHALAVRLAFLLTDERTRRRLGDRGYAQSAKYRWDRSVAEMVDFIEQIPVRRIGKARPERLQERQADRFPSRL